MGNKQQSLESAEKAVDLDPFSPEAIINLAYSHLINHHFSDALKYAKKAYELQPDWPTVSFYIALIHYHRGNPEESQKHVEDLVVPWTRNGPQLLLALIDIKSQKKQTTYNLEYFSREKDFFSQGILHAVLKDKEKAFKAFENIPSWEPWPTQVMHHLFPNELKDIKKDPRFSTLSDTIDRDWRKQT